MAPVKHIEFIVAAYAAAVVVVAFLIAWVMIDYRALRRTLADLDRRGVTRRTAPARPEPAREQA